jgi:hypothetical protein
MPARERWSRGSAERSRTSPQGRDRTIRPELQWLEHSTAEIRMVELKPP